MTTSHSQLLPLTSSGSIQRAATEPQRNMEEKESSAGDQRLHFLQERVLKTLRLKPDRWQKCLAVEEQKQVIQDFLDKSEHTTLVIYLTAAGQLIPAADFAGSQKNKAVYFIKRGKTGLTPDSIKTNVYFGTLSGPPLEQLPAFVEEVVVPVLRNTKNHFHRPRVVSEDLMQHAHVLRTSVSVVVGQAKRKTVLPLPPGSERIEQAASEIEKRGELVDKSIIHSIESMVIGWRHQIHGVLKRDSAEPLLEGTNPTPQVELNFWKNRYANLQCINDHFKSPKVTKMAHLLDVLESSYYPAYRNMVQDVERALEEARDINMFLKPLQRLTEDLESTEFGNVKKGIAPLMHTICLVWANSKHYNTPARVIVLLQEFCNLFIQQARSHLNPEDILKGEVAESIAHVQTTLDVLMHFKSVFEDKRNSLSQYQRNGREVKPWDFSSSMVFAELDRFIERLKMIETLLLAVVDMMKLEKLEFGGVRGRSLSQQVVWLHEEFQERFKILAEYSYFCSVISPAHILSSQGTINT